MSAQPAPRPYQWRLLPGLAIIAVGVLFLLHNLGIRLDFLFRGNWWAWFILIAAVPPLKHAYHVFRASGRINAEAIYNVLLAAVIVLVAVMFLMGLQWSVWWPLFLIVAGLFTLIRRPGRRPHQQHREWQQEDRDSTVSQ